MKDYDQLKVYYRAAMGLAEDAPVSNSTIDDLSKRNGLQEAKDELLRDQRELSRIKAHTQRLLKIS